MSLLPEAVSLLPELPTMVGGVRPDQLLPPEASVVAVPHL